MNSSSQSDALGGGLQTNPNTDWLIHLMLHLTIDSLIHLMIHLTINPVIHFVVDSLIHLMFNSVI